MAMITHPTEIHERLRKRFLDRLSVRMKKLRKELIDRDWPGLRAECRALKGSGDTFGFLELTRLAEVAEVAIPESATMRAQVIPAAKAAVEALIAEIDSILTASEIKGD